MEKFRKYFTQILEYLQISFTLSIMFSLGIIFLFHITGCHSSGKSNENIISPISAITYDESNAFDLSKKLTSVGSVVSYYLSSTKGTVVLLPANNKSEKYGITLTTFSSSSNTSARVSLRVPFLSIYENTSVINHNKSFMLQKANRTMAKDFSNASIKLNQIILAAEFRNRLKGKSSIYRPQLNLHANSLVPPTYADNSNEQIGDIKTFWIYARSVFGLGQQEYTQRHGKLLRIGKYIKIFVDIDQYDNLSAVEGSFKVTDDQLNKIVYELDNYGVKMILENYGEPWDIDKDNRVTIFITPLLTKNGFAGFFDTKHYEITTETGEINTYCNKRDMIAVWSAGYSSEWVGDKWLYATIETCIHELQHMVSYSIRARKNNYPTFLSGDMLEDTWLDESMSVTAEARYRISRGFNPSEDRFEVFSKSITYNWSLLSFVWTLESYGHLGLFGLYLWEQGGDDTIKDILNADSKGKATLDNIFSDRNGLEGLYKDFGIAMLVEGLLAKQEISEITLDQIPSKYKFIHRLNLPLNITYLNNFRTNQEIAQSINSYATFFGYIYVPNGYLDKVLPLELRADIDSVINIIRLQ